MANESRVSAMTWWNGLSSLRKTHICDTATELVGAIRRHESLTGREIQQLWEVETNQSTRDYEGTIKHFQDESGCDSLDDYEGTIKHFKD
jgi:hypothetical protein